MISKPTKKQCLVQCFDKDPRSVVVLLAIAAGIAMVCGNAVAAMLLVR